MKITSAKAGSRAKDEGPLFVGEVKRQALVEDGAIRLVEVEFVAGARTKMHTHSTDQVLIISAGDGIVGTPSEQHNVVLGDVVFIPAGEAHFHGAAPAKGMSHYSLLGPGQKVAILD